MIRFWGGGGRRPTRQYLCRTLDLKTEKSTMGKKPAKIVTEIDFPFSQNTVLLGRVRKGSRPYELGSCAPISPTFWAESGFSLSGQYGGFGAGSGGAKKGV